jgi:hypothetical protein
LRRKDRPIILFTKMELDPYSSREDIFYSREELFCSYEWTAQLGVDALVIWSTSSRMRQRCQPIADYLDQVFGPFVAQLRARTEEWVREQGNGEENALPFPSAEAAPSGFATAEADVCSGTGGDSTGPGERSPSLGPGTSSRAFARAGPTSTGNTATWPGPARRSEEGKA